MIARDRLMNAMARALTNAELAAMSAAVALETARRADVKAVLAARASQPPIHREEESSPETPQAKAKSGEHVRADRAHLLAEIHRLTQAGAKHARTKTGT